MYILVILPTYENFSMKLTSAECTVKKLLVMGREDGRNM